MIEEILKTLKAICINMTKEQKANFLFDNFGHKSFSEVEALSEEEKGTMLAKLKIMFADQGYQHKTITSPVYKIDNGRAIKSHDESWTMTINTNTKSVRDVSFSIPETTYKYERKIITPYKDD